MKKIVIISGDPNSINSEIIYKTWKQLSNSIKRNLYLIANYKLICEQFKKLNFKIKTLKVKNIDEGTNLSFLKIIDIPISFNNPFNVPRSNASKYVKSSFNYAHKLASNKRIKGFINCPVDKILISEKKIKGITEFLAAKSKIKKDSEVMLIHNKKLSVVPLTTHINIKDVSKNINIDLIKKN